MIPKVNKHIVGLLNVGNVSALAPLNRLARQIFIFDCSVGVLMVIATLLYFVPNNLYEEGEYNLPFTVLVGAFYLTCILLTSWRHYLLAVGLSLVGTYAIIFSVPFHQTTWFEPLFLIPVGLNGFLYLPNKGGLARVIFLVYGLSGLLLFFAFWNDTFLASEMLQHNMPSIKYGLINLTFLITYKIIALILLYQQTIRKSEENELKYKNLFENTYDSITLINDQSCIIDANKAARELLGMEKGQQVFVPEMVHADYQEVFRKFVQKLYEKGSYSGLHTRIINLRGETLDIEINSVGIKDENGNITGSLDIFRDITEKKKIETALLQSEKRYRHIFEVNSVGMLVTDISAVMEQLDALRETGHVDVVSLVKKQPHLLYSSYQLVRFKDCNQTLLDLVGLPTFDEFKRQFKQIIKPASLGIFILEAQAMMKGKGHFEGEIELTTLEGEEKTLFYSVIYPSDGDVSRVVYTFIDITEKKHYEQELERHVEELTKANEELDSFVYKVAHDLRAPLTNVMGLINLAQDDEEVKGAEKYLDLQKQSVERIDTFIRDIVDFTRNVRQDVKKTSIDFESLVDEVIGLQQEEVLGNSLVVYKNIDEGTFLSDPTRIRIILNNLISNAVQYADLEKEESWMKVDVKISAESCILTVEDNGKGIERRYQQNVFDMFFRGNSKTRGSGLGLYIVKEIAEKLQAKVELESEWKKYTKVSIIFPQEQN